MTIHLRDIKFTIPANQALEFPYNLKVFRQLKEMCFTSPVTIFIGENGTGKSTLLEGIAITVQLATIGRQETSRDVSLDAVRPLADGMKLRWNKVMHRGFFLRAEDFFGFVTHVREMRQSMKDEIDRIEREYEGRSDYAKALAKGPAAESIHALDQRYSGDLGMQSHGESFLTLFQSRFVPGGLYLLDEPEAALSPLSQLGLITLIKKMILEDAQFIIATHSPILMAIPEAQLLNFDASPPESMDYNELDHVQLYRSFLEDPRAFIDRL